MMCPLRLHLLSILFSPRMIVQLFLGFSSGLPLLLTGSTLQAWLKDANVGLGAIGLFALVGLPYTLKFLWAPVLDSITLPFLGRRRGWMIAVQIMLAVCIAWMGLADPKACSCPGFCHGPMTLAVLALLLAFFSATQDIVLDAFRRESLNDHELGLGSSIFVNGYRMGMLVSGALALALADMFSWQIVYCVMASAMAVGIITTIVCTEPVQDQPPPRGFQEAVILPLEDFFSRSHAVWMLMFVLLYKIGDQMAANMTMPFVLELGFSKTELAAIAKLFGMGATITGGLAGGLLMLRLGITQALWIFGVLQAISTLCFSVLSEIGPSSTGLAITVSLENLSSGMGTSALVAYMASLTNTKFTATQYALISSLMGVPRVFVAAPTGYLALAMGWTGYFVFCAIIAIPGLFVLAKIAPWNTQTHYQQLHKT